ncbi:hypothetical protein B0H15DRAFT_958071 [Mycena belliarum]|uniref:Uncharacterized protein n=1 Tax=Mycena belliarum TaxID=1033014 RepID=A0AAD6TL62_9AGAR|nr:hypothetical protein B0H15DRAFT_958071 [Mycena belliae]
MSSKDFCTVADSSLLTFSKNVDSALQTKLRDIILRAILKAKKDKELPDDRLKAYWAYLKENGWIGPAPGSIPKPTGDSSPSYNAGPMGLTVYNQLVDALSPMQRVLLNLVFGALAIPGHATDALDLLRKRSTISVVEASENSESEVKDSKLVSFMVGMFHSNPSGNIILETCHIGYKYRTLRLPFGQQGIYDIWAVSHNIEYKSTGSSSSSSSSELSSREKRSLCPVDIAFIPTQSSVPDDTISTSGDWQEPVEIIENPTIIVNHPVQIADKEIWNLNFTTQPVPVQFVGFIKKASPHDCVIKVYLCVPIPLLGKILPKYKFATVTGSLADGITVMATAKEVGIKSTLSLSIPRNLKGEKHLLIDLAVNSPYGNFHYPHIDIKVPFI